MKKYLRKYENTQLCFVFCLFASRNAIKNSLESQANAFEIFKNDSSPLITIMTIYLFIDARTFWIFILFIFRLNRNSFRYIVLRRPMRSKCPNAKFG